MNRTQKLTLAASALIVGGLFAVAVPVVASAIGELSSWAILEPQSAEPTRAPSSPEQVIAIEEDGPLVLEDGTRLQTIDGQTFSADGPGNCTTNAAIHPYGTGDPGAKLRGDLVDMGATEFAEGAVGYNADGLIETYTVDPGDSLIAVGERFCVDYVTVGAYNDRFASNAIQPGDVLILRP